MSLLQNVLAKHRLIARTEYVPAIGQWLRLVVLKPVCVSESQEVWDGLGALRF